MGIMHDTVYICYPMGQLTIIPGVEIIELGLQNHFPRAGAMRLRLFLLIFKVNLQNMHIMVNKFLKKER
jgi:hypothetical protein